MSEATAASRRPLRREAAENRERLLLAARQVFAIRGLDAPVEEIARAAGVGLGTFYRRFPTKQAIVDELVGQLRRDLLRVARRARQRDPATALEIFLFDAGKVHAREPGYMQFLWSRSNAEQAAIDEVLQILDDLLTSAKAAGRIRADITITDIWMTLWSLRGIIEITLTTTPTAWKRHLQLHIRGMQTQPPTLTATPMTLAHARQAIGRVSR
jgi:AcrR family transcriptional regulator